MRAGLCRGFPAEPGSAAMGTLGVPIGCLAGRGHGWPALPMARCKGRGVCPSCNGRRMAQTAAHLVDRVILPVPVRQWVISVPKRLRCFLADRPNAVPVCADEKNPALSVARKLFGTSTIGSHTAQPAPAVAPHDPPRSAVACRSAIGRPILRWSAAFALRAVRLMDHPVSQADLPRSLRPGNLTTLLRAVVHNRPLVHYLVAQALQSMESRMEALRQFYPAARTTDWRSRRACLICSTRPRGGPA